MKRVNTFSLLSLSLSLSSSLDNGSCSKKERDWRLKVNLYL